MIDRVNKYNNTYHKTMRMDSVNVNSSTYIYLNKKNKMENRKFKVGDLVRIQKYKNIFAKGCIPNWSKEAFVMKKV